MCSNILDSPRLTEDENWLLNHLMMWGSDAYPIHKLSKGWTWGPVRSIQGPPVIYKTKRECIESFERYEQMLIDRKAGRI